MQNGDCHDMLRNLLDIERFFPRATLVVKQTVSMDQLYSGSNLASRFISNTSFINYL